MSTTTIEDQLDEIHRRIDRLQALAQAGAPRIRRHLDALHQEEAAVRAAVRQAPDEVEEKLGRLRTRLAVAEHSLAADLSDDWATFAAAVEAELRSRDTYLERLQTSVAAKAWKKRASRPRRRSATFGAAGSPSASASRRRATPPAPPRRKQGRTDHRGPRRARTEGRRAVGELNPKGAET